MKHLHEAPKFLDHTYITAKPALGEEGPHGRAKRGQVDESLGWERLHGQDKGILGRGREDSVRQARGTGGEKGTQMACLCRLCRKWAWMRVWERPCVCETV